MLRELESINLSSDAINRNARVIAHLRSVTQFHCICSYLGGSGGTKSLLPEHSGQHRLVHLTKNRTNRKSVDSMRYIQAWAISHRLCLKKKNVKISSLIIHVYLGYIRNISRKKSLTTIDRSLFFEFF